MSEVSERKFSYDEVRRARDRFTDALNAWPRRMRRLPVRFGTGLCVPTEAIKTWHVVIIVHNERDEVLAGKLAEKYMPGIPTDIRFADNRLATSK